MISKYCPNIHLNSAIIRPHHSMVWKRVYRVRNLTEQHIFWSNGKGRFFVFYDTWLGENLLTYQESLFLQRMRISQYRNWDENRVWNHKIRDLARVEELN